MGWREEGVDGKGTYEFEFPNIEFTDVVYTPKSIAIIRYAFMVSYNPTTINTRHIH